ncbi:hypothetical protein P4E94_19185 [Pontiellaceae bacterium B12219]|nr:hypothetical protein [Pontiellaceae bacterium B12219]
MKTPVDSVYGLCAPKVTHNVRQKMKKIISILMASFPALAFAQLAEDYEPSIWETTGSILKHYIAWPALCLIIISVATWFLLIPFKKRIIRFKTIHTAIVISVFCIWYFYPCINYKGTYVAEFEWSTEKEESFIVIDDQFYMHDGKFVGSYHINPIQRMLWVEKSYFLDPEYPVKLRWNKVIAPMFKIGWVEHKKTKANQRLEPTLKTPADSVNTNSSEAHP